jgi:hypothetical protein
MYDDNPNFRAYYGIINNLFKDHPVKIDIAGTVESIAEINADLLYKCYYTFYNLNNMVLSIAGNVDEDKVLEMCTKAAMVVPQVGFIGWDVCITPDGPVIVEGNDYPGHDLYQLPEHTHDKKGIWPKYQF